LVFILLLLSKKQEIQNKRTRGKDMKKQYVIGGTIALLICIGLSGCTNNSTDTVKNKFIGTWNHPEQNSQGVWTNTTYTFYSNGTFSYGAGGTWDINNGNLTMNLQGSFPATMVYTYSFSNNDATLTLSAHAGIVLVFTKQ
jgi:hypothetical protein